MPEFVHAAWTAVLDFDYWSEIGTGTVDTLVMSGLSLVFTVLIGLPVGTVLFLTAWGHRSRRPGVAAVQAWTYRIVSFVVNVLRSVPFLILLILLIPATRWLVGTSLGVQGAIPPLVIAAAPFFARLVENLLREVDSGVLEACRAMGATTRQTVFWALIPEAFSGL